MEDERYLKARERVLQLKGFYSHLVIFAIINALLFLINWGSRLVVVLMGHPVLGNRTLYAWSECVWKREAVFQGLGGEENPPVYG